MSEVMWRWQRLDAEGNEMPSAGDVFPTRSDAETWIGETWAELAEQGVAAVVLYEGDREVYGPMSLAAE